MADELRTSLEGVIEHFDLGEYEVEAYLAVLQHGELTASQLADETDVPQPRVYDTVRDLGQIGLVEVTDSRPMRVLAIDPRDAFAEIQNSLDDLIDDLTATYTAPARQPEAVSLVKSRATILRHLEDAIAEAEYELLCSLTPDLLERFAEDLRDRREDGVAIDLLLSPAAGAPDPEDRDYDALAGAVRTRRGVTTPVVAVADGDYSLYATRESIAGDSERYGVVFNRSELGFLVSGFFNTVLWTTADAISTDRTDPTFPRKYGTIRRCIADLQALEGPFYATVEGRDVRSGDPRRISGEVVAAELGSSREVATLEVEADGEVVAVGDRVACYEDLEAFEIHVGRDEPPEISR